MMLPSGEPGSHHPGPDSGDRALAHYEVFDQQVDAQEFAGLGR
jgi:hypothetical protein